MDDSRAATHDPLRFRLVAAAVATLLALIAWIPAAYGPSRLPTTLGFAGTAVSFVVILTLSLALRDSAIVRGAASGIAATTRALVVGLVLFGITAPMVMFLFDNPLLIKPTAEVTEVAAHIGGGGVLLLLAVFALQYPLASEARRASGDSAERWVVGEILGWALGLAPVLIAMSVGSSLAHRRVDPADWESRDKTISRFAAADSLRRLVRSDALPRRILAELHACIYSGCVDSLMRAAKRDSVIVRYNELGGHRYWASVQVGRGNFARRLVTDETGTLLDWPVRSVNYDNSAPDSTQPLYLADTTVRELSHVAACAWDEYQLQATRLRKHAPHPCGLSGDTTRIRVANGTDYVVELQRIRPTKARPRGDLALIARPERYARTDARSFLIQNQGKDVLVTTENRAVRPTDQRAHLFELIGGWVEVATH